MGVSVLPALSELLLLILILVAIMAAGVSFIWLNFKIWSAKLYLPLMGLVSLTVGVTVFTFGGSILTASFFAAVPFLIALYFKLALKGNYRSATLFLAPATLGIIFLFLYPLVFEFYLSFHDLSLRTFSDWINGTGIPLASQGGFGNYIEVFQNRATGQSFIFVLWRTIVWTAVNLVFHLGVGLALALLLNTKGVRGVGIYRTVLTLPWVIPQVIAVLVWRADFNENIGFVNQFIMVTNQLFSWQWNGEWVQPLTWIGFQPQAWFLDGDALFTAACIVNIWLGIPFMMINCLGALQSIPHSVYEAASIDGAGWLQKFRHVTLPLLKPVMVPAAILGGIWTFNNLNVIFLLTDGGRYEGADILVTDLFKQSFTYYRYGFAAAYSFVIFAILCVLTVLQLRASRENRPNLV